MPDSIGRKKSDTIGDRQKQLAMKRYELGLLSAKFSLTILYSSKVRPSKGVRLAGLRKIGIFAAPKALRHADIAVTAAHYLDKKERVSVGLGAL
jgi:hypothetical protein